MSIDHDTSAGSAGSRTTEVRIRPLEQGDFFAWYELFAGYAEFTGTALTDERTMRAWAWLHGDKASVRGLVALGEENQIIALAHVQEFERPLENDRGLYLEDLFVSPDHRNRGVATAIVNHLKQDARERGLGLIRWVTTDANENARQFSESLGERTDLVTYDLRLG
ncbi:GNAT family N-acetyltransferase [Naasia sp. SYSU D00948]|uniref:GNAT family N-acetyltransferase n=1 Tax=Naasia sp. SYSU D00948 TaxID=2817379 RepID=UPI001B3148CA|nr:GNAT family N-acetyltransferase [Naasia sp. SYSU D00948]